MCVCACACGNTFFKNVRREQDAILAFYSEEVTHLTSLKVFHYICGNFQCLGNGPEIRRVIVGTVETDIDCLSLAAVKLFFGGGDVVFFFFFLALLASF